jgi:cytochrome c553
LAHPKGIPAVIYKQLADYRSGKRLWGVMNGIAQALSVKESADVASYFAGRLGGLPAVTGLRVPEAGRSLRQSNPAIHLVFAGDPARGIAPCSAGHGPGGYKLGAPALQQQRTLYIEKPAVGLRSRHAPERHQRADAHDREAIDTGEPANGSNISVGGWGCRTVRLTTQG